MQSIFEEIRSLPAHVVAVSFSKPERVTFHLEGRSLPFPVLSDPALAAYGAYGLGRTTLGRILRPGVLWRFAKIMFRGWIPTKPDKGDDVMQLGGDFVIDAAGILRYAHPSAEPSDRPSMAALLQALREAAAIGSTEAASPTR